MNLFQLSIIILLNRHLKYLQIILANYRLPGKPFVTYIHPNISNHFPRCKWPPTHPPSAVVTEMMVVQTATPRPCEVLTSSGPSAPPMVTGTLPALHHCHAATPSGEDIVALVLYFAASINTQLHIHVTYDTYTLCMLLYSSCLSSEGSGSYLDTSTSTNIGLYIG